jgi:uncharacterized protein (TIGR02147 family)
LTAAKVLEINRTSPTRKTNLSVLNYLDYKPFLKDVFFERKTSRFRYSYYQFSEDLGFGKTNNSHLIINGKRKLTKLNRDRVIIALGLGGRERKYFALLVRFVNLKNGPQKNLILEKLTRLKNGQLRSGKERDNLAFLNHWINSAVFELIGTGPGEGVNLEWLQRHLRVNASPKLIVKSLKLLEDMSLIQRVGDTERYVRTEEKMRLGSEIQGLGVFRYHQKMIELGMEALEKIHYEQRDISALTFSVPEEMVAELKMKINEFRAQIADLSHKYGLNEEGHSKKSVIQLNIQMFPLSK